MAARFIREQLAPHHDLRAFDCGVPELDAWLRDTAARAMSRGYSRVYVWQQEGVVVAYFTLSSYLVLRELLPRARGEWREIPALLLGKFALDRSLQGEGLARVLIADAIREAVRAASIAGARLLVVDAISAEAASIYERFGFTRVGDAGRLVASIADLAAGVQP